MENSELKTQSTFVNVFDLTSATADATSSAVEASDSTSNKSAPEVPVIAMGSLPFSGNVADAASKIGAIKGGEIELVLYQNVSIGTGSRANNAWLQEVSDPIAKATWDNYAMVSPEIGKSLLGIDIFNRPQSDKYEVSVHKPIIKVTANGKAVEIPALIIPGMHPNVIAMAVGYGRQSNDKKRTAEFIGPAANGSGVNVYQFAIYSGTWY